VFLEPKVHDQRRELPGTVRQRLRRVIDGLGSDPRPHNSQELDLAKLGESVNVPRGVELRRLRIEHWRIVYVVDENWEVVIVLTIRRRPPYDYEDLRDIIAGLQETS
jgi:mRNA interferase RelE/StbE